MTDTTQDPAVTDAQAAQEAARLRFEAVSSPEYQRALDAQIDYDSTPEGQKVLDSLIAQCEDPGEKRGLIARKVAGEHARKFGREFWVFVPKMVKRGEPGYAEYRNLVNAREALVRLYACAAAETNVWGTPSPGTVTNLRDKHAEIVELEQAAGHVASPWRHPQLIAATEDARTPWLGSKRLRPVHVGDVALLVILGLKAQWSNGRLYVQGKPDAMFRWGYQAAPVEEEKFVVVSAPDLVAYQKDHPRP